MKEAIIDVRDLEKILWIESDEQAADSLTKVEGNEKLLLAYISVTKKEKEKEVKLRENSEFF